MSNRLFQGPTGVAQKAYAPSLQHPDRQINPPVLPVTPLAGKGKPTAA